MDESVWQNKKAQRPCQRPKQRICEASEESVILDGFGKTREKAEQCSGREIRNSRRDHFQECFKK